MAASMKSGAMHKRCGVRAGLPDTRIVHRGKPIFIEMKSPAGVASRSQKRVRIELLAAGATWWMARSARAAMMALHLSSVVFRKRWRQARLAVWEGPFADPTQRLPQHPTVAPQRRAARKRWRERQQRARAATHPTPELTDAGAQTAARGQRADTTALGEGCGNVGP